MRRSVKPLPALKRRVLSLQQHNSHQFQLGNLGEKRAAQYLLVHGFHIWEQNLYINNFEIDLIAWDQRERELAFIEVKTRSSTAFGHPSLAVDWRKQHKLKVAAIQYLHYRRLSIDYRFDIIAVLPTTVDHLQRAF